ncbi:PAAR-like domain-containing protein [Myxococcus eversor]|uniref:PAAR-like domain-containing protein n=1 Tax=Myxococcus eversor TaxID=2709661 RepID=UPI0013CF661C|nr:PAAR-like domain-containing protein [Myxococcus eversor]
MTKTFVDKKSVVHAGDGLQFVAMAPDVCKTPSPGGPVPVPYPNLAVSSDLSQGSKSVEIEGNAVALEDSFLKKSTGDEGGTAGGGLASSKIQGKLTWLLFSMSVKFEGKGVVRFMDDGMHNGNAGNTPGKNMGYPGHDDKTGEIVCDNCGKPLASPGHPQLKGSTESFRSAEQVRGRTTAAVVVKCKKGSSAFSGVAGDLRSSLTPDNFAQKAVNFKHKTPIPSTGPADRNPAGNCAEQKALFQAFEKGAFPVGMGCEASMTVLRETQNGKSAVPSCDTCKRVLTSMLCENAPKGRG